MSTQKVLLGRHLFYEPRLSGDGTYSCASCHVQALAFTDGRGRAVGATGQMHPRSAMSLTNIAYASSLGWANPELTALEAQIRVPMFNTDPIELGISGQEAEVLARLRADSGYRERFAASFPDAPEPVSLDNARYALAAFVRTLISGESAYDRLVYGDRRDALDGSARRGMRLFFSPRLGCAACHAGFNFSGPVRYRGAGAAEPDFHNTGLYNLGGEGRYPAPNRGLYEVTGRAGDMGRFRAPTLRNVARTAPYMHDGSIATLAQAIEHYAAGGRTIERGELAGRGSENPARSELVTGFALSDGEKADLVRFLESLTDERFLSDPRFADPGSDGR